MLKPPICILPSASKNHKGKFCYQGPQGGTSHHGPQGGGQFWISHPGGQEEEDFILLYLLTNQCLVLHYRLIWHRPLQSYRDSVTLTFENGIIKSRLCELSPAIRSNNQCPWIFDWGRNWEELKESIELLRKSLSRRAGVKHWVVEVVWALILLCYEFEICEWSGGKCHSVA